MNRIQRYLAVLVGLSSSLFALATAAPAALATLPPPDPGTPVVMPQHVLRTIVTGGMPGWQVAMIAAGAASLTATGAVLLDRARTSRRGAIVRAT